MPAAVAAVPAKKPLPADVPFRRFSTADLSTHGAWILPRLMALLPQLGERGVAGWLAGKIYSNDYLFLYQEHAVALAQVVFDESLNAKPLVRERFVWAKAPEYAAEAAVFYDEIRAWAKRLGAEAIIVEESSDVPHDVVREKLGRIFTRQMQFARV